MIRYLCNLCGKAHERQEAMQTTTISIETENAEEIELIINVCSKCAYNLLSERPIGT